MAIITALLIGCAVSLVFLLLILESRLRRSYFMVSMYSAAMIYLITRLYGFRMAFALIVINAVAGAFVIDSKKINKEYKKRQYKAYKRGFYD